MMRASARYMPVIVIAALAVVALAAGFAISSSGALSGHVGDGSMELRATAYSKTLTARSNADVDDAEQVVASSGGTVGDVFASRGDRVAKGDVIVSLVNEEVTQAAEKAKRDYEEATRELSSARQEADDAAAAAEAASLAGSKGASAFDIVGLSASSQMSSQAAAAAKRAQEAARSAELALEDAERRAEEAKSKMDAANADVEGLSIKAPASGTIVSIKATAGEKVSEGDEICTIVDYERAVVTFAFALEDHVHEGQAITLSCGSASFDTAITSVEDEGAFTFATVSLAGLATPVSDEDVITARIALPPVEGVYVTEAWLVELSGDLATGTVRVVDGPFTSHLEEVTVVDVTDDGMIAFSAAALADGTRITNP